MDDEALAARVREDVLRAFDLEPWQAGLEPAPPEEGARVGEQDELTAWLRRRIEQRKHLAEHAMELGNAAVWTELSSGVLLTCRPDNPQDDPHDRWDGVHAMGDSSLTRLMEANDPRDTIARCETELRVLDEYAAAVAVAEAERAKPGGPGPGVMACVRTLGQVVRLHGRAYRHWEGYREDWAP